MPGHRRRQQSVAGHRHRRDVRRAHKPAAARRVRNEANNVAVNMDYTMDPLRGLESAEEYGGAVAREYLTDDFGERREWMLDAFTTKVLGLLYRDTVSSTEVALLLDALNRLRGSLSTGSEDDADLRAPWKGSQSTGYLAIEALNGQPISAFRGDLHKHLPNAILRTLGLDDRSGPLLLGHRRWATVKDAYRRFTLRLPPPADGASWADPLKHGRTAHRWFYARVGLTGAAVFILCMAAAAAPALAYRLKYGADRAETTAGSLAIPHHIDGTAIPFKDVAAVRVPMDTAEEVAALRREVARLRKDLIKHRQLSDARQDP